METSVWLKVEGKERYGRVVAGPVHAFKTKPGVGPKEIAVRLTLEIPDSVFEEPVFEAKATLPDVKRSVPIRAEVAANVAKALSDNMGFKVRVEIPAPEAVTNGA
jgi:hypothetical protein